MAGAVVVVWAAARLMLRDASAVRSLFDGEHA
jgi:hypothetical protein